MSTPTRTFRRLWWLTIPLLFVILAGIAGLTAATLGQNQVPPAVAAAALLFGGGGLLVAVLPRLRGQDQLVGCGGMGAGLIVVFVGSAMTWRHVPTLSGWSNQGAETQANRIIAKLTSYPPGQSNLPNVRQEWLQADELAEFFPNLAPNLKQAQTACAARFEKHLQKLRSGECSEDEFRSRLPERRSVAEKYPEFRDQVPTDELTWGEFQLRKLLDRLASLRSDGKLQNPEHESIRLILDQFPNLAAKLALAEEDWLTRTEGHLAETMRKLSPTDADGFLACRASASGFLQLNPSRGTALREAESDWYRRCEEVGLKEAGQYLGANPVQAATELVATVDRLKKTGAAETLPSGLKFELIRTVRQSIDVAKRKTRDAIRADRYQAAARNANQLNLSLGRAAELVGLSEELKEFCESCRFLAELAEQAGKSDPP